MGTSVMSGMTSPGGKSRDTTAACLGNPPAKTPCTRSLLVAWKGAVGHRSANDGGGQSIRRHGEAPWAPQAPALNPACSRRFFSSTVLPECGGSRARRRLAGATSRGGAGLIEHELVARKMGIVGLLVGYGRLWAGGVWTWTRQARWTVV